MARTKNTFYNEFDLQCYGERSRRDERDNRSQFQIDRDRILFSYAFRRLQSKTQVFQSGEYDFYRTRLTHTIEVARIARSIADALLERDPHLREDFYIDPDLVEGIGYAHDIGHPPFGHIGERKLNELMGQHGGFEGNAQTLRIITDLIFEAAEQPRGMQPTRAFIDGVLKYKALHHELCTKLGEPPANHFLYDEQASVRSFVFEGIAELPQTTDAWNDLKSVECQIMDWADDTAYSLHDIVDGVRAGFITPRAVEAWAAKQPDQDDGFSVSVEELCKSIHDGRLERRLGARIGDFIHACSLEERESPLAGHSNRYAFQLAIAPEVIRDCHLKKRVALDLIFRSATIQQTEFRGGIALGRLFDAYWLHYVEHDPEDPQRLRILPATAERSFVGLSGRRQKARALCDYLASMTDAQAVRAYKRLYEPGHGSLGELI